MLRLLSYNIRYGGVGRETAIASVIRACSPHIVILQEATRPRVVEQLAALTGLSVWGARRARSLAYLSRLPIARSEWRRPFWSRHAYLELTPADVDVHIVGVHLSAVHAAWTERRRTLELRALLGAIRAHAGRFHVLAGDFNTLAPGELLDPLKLPPRLRSLLWLSGGTIRWQTIHTILKADYVDGWKRAHPDALGVPTFPTWAPHLRLDYVFLPSSFADRLRQCEVVTAPPEVRSASDHFPLFAELDTQRPSG
jgi:endonuclease/exonuclease/phosphatase family metal-dependent hydrolase